MDASSQVFATGGASGIVMAVLWLVYRFFFSRHRVVSRCCGREFSLETEGSTPNINPMVVKDASASPPHPTQQGLTDSAHSVGERRLGSISGENQLSVLPGEPPSHQSLTDREGRTGNGTRTGEGSSTRHGLIVSADTRKEASGKEGDEVSVQRGELIHADAQPASGGDQHPPSEDTKSEPLPKPS